MPFAATLDATQRAAGVAPKGSPRFETGKSIGQMLGGMGLMVLGGIGTGGGFALSLTQIGAAIGIPVAALSVGVTITGMANAAAGWQGLLQSLSTGGSAGPPGVSAGPAGPVKPQGQVHHAISKKVWKALEEHKNLGGRYKYRDERFTTRGADLDAHKGYQKWHQDLDDEVAEWINTHKDATPDVFEKYLRERYTLDDLKMRFPNGL